MLKKRMNRLLSPFVCFSGLDFTTCQQLPCGGWGWETSALSVSHGGQNSKRLYLSRVEWTSFSKYMPYHFPLTKFPNIISAGKAEHKPFCSCKTAANFPVTVRLRADKVKLTYLMTEIWKNLWGWNYNKINNIKLRKMHKVQHLNF